VRSIVPPLLSGQCTPHREEVRSWCAENTLLFFLSMRLEVLRTSFGESTFSAKRIVYSHSFLFLPPSVLSFPFSPSDADGSWDLLSMRTFIFSNFSFFLVDGTACEYYLARFSNC